MTLSKIDKLINKIGPGIVSCPTCHTTFNWKGFLSWENSFCSECHMELRHGCKSCTEHRGCTECLNIKVSILKQRNGVMKYDQTQTAE